jgi:superfamily II RNA helicase
VLSRGKGGCRAMARLLRASHERRAQQRIFARTAVQMFESLKTAGVVEVTADRGVVVNADLQEDFSLNHALSLYLLHAVELLERESDTYALDLLTLVESILENPDLVLMRQLDKLKTEKLAELKAAGVEYDQRMEELEKLEYPKPNAGFIYDTFNAFAREHPWVQEDNIRPKSVARDMVEQFLSFSEYVREYGLERGEGVLLRYLSDVYKTLVQSVPEPAKTAEVDDIVVYLGAIVRATDSSLLDEWERMRTGGEPAPTVTGAPGEADVTRSDKELTVLVRNAAFAVLRHLARKQYADAAALVGSERWTADSLEKRFAAFWEEHTALAVDPKARAPENTRIVSREGGVWKIEQVILDPEDANDWALEFRMDVARAREEGRAVLELVEVMS